MCAATEQGSELSEGRHWAVFSILPGFCGPCCLAVSQRRHTLLSLPLQLKVCVCAYEQVPASAHTSPHSCMRPGTGDNRT